MQLSDTGSPLYAQIDRSMHAALMPLRGVEASKKDAEGPKRINRRIITVALSPSDMTAIDSMFDEFQCEFRSVRTIVNGLSRVVSQMAREALYMLLRGRPYKVIEVTDQFTDAVKAGRKHVHVCVPMTYDEDYVQFYTSMLDIRSMRDRMRIVAGGDNRMYSHLTDFLSNTPKRVCVSPSTCTVEAGVILVDLITHFVPLVQVAGLALKRGASRVYGFFLYSSRMMSEDDFRFDDLNISVRIDRTSDTMVMYTEDGPIMPPVQYTQYMHYARANSITLGQRTFICELMDKRGSLHFIRMQDVGSDARLSGDTCDTLKHVLWLDNMKTRMYLVRSYRLKRRSFESPYMSEAVVDPGDPRNYEPYEFLAPAPLIYNVLVMACSLPKGKLSYEVVYRRLQQVSSRVIVDCVRVEQPYHMSADQLQHLAYVLFILAYQMRYDDAMVFNRVKATMSMLDQLVHKSATSMVASWLYHSMVTGYATYEGALSDKLRELVQSRAEPYPLVPTIKKIKPYEISDDILVYRSIRSLSGIVLNPSYGDRSTLSVFVDKPALITRIANSTSALIERVRHATTSVAKWGTDVLTVACVDADVHNDAEHGTAPLVTYGDSDDSGSVTLDESRQSLVKKIADEGDVFDTSEIMPLIEASADIVEHIEHEQVLCSDDPLSDIQEIYARMFPGMVEQKTSLDAFDMTVCDWDARVATTGMQITMSAKDGVGIPEVYSAKLITGVPQDRPPSTVDALNGLIKRNLDSDCVEESAHLSVMVNRVINNFLDRACVPHARDLLENFAKNPVLLNEDNLSYWVSRLSPEKVERYMGMDFTLDDLAIDCYEYMTKRTVKPGMEDTSELRKAQTVIYHKGPINAWFSPIAMEVMRRLTSILDPRILVNTRKNHDQIEQFLGRYESFGRRMVYLENDFKSYDKNQGVRCLMLEWVVMSLLGVTDEDMTRWVSGHVDTVAIDSRYGIKTQLAHQRKSGDATTTLGNTIVNLLTLVDIYAAVDLDRIAYMMLLGDDSLVAMYPETYVPVDLVRVSHEMAFRFNLVAKALINDHGYFCSHYIIATPNGIRFMRDPVKVAETLGRDINTKDDFVAKHESLRDTLAGYDDMVNLHALDSAVQRRWNLTYSVMPLLCALATIKQDFSAYRGLFSTAKLQLYG